MQFLSLSNGMLAVCIVVPIVALLLIFAIWYIVTKNKLIALRNDMEESFSSMDISMKKRYDLIPNLVETCKGYTKHEGETLARVTQARSMAMSASREERPAAEKELASSLKVLMNRVQEAYPQLKADSQFNNLSKQLEQLEHEIAQSRKYYNAKVKLINNKIEQFPSSFVANRMRLARYPYFELEDVAERVNTQVKF